ncbi:MAG TPA: histidine phosphatase family protein [Ignavibacteria bacterium]|jgi:phosphohistidine phosphatase
MKTLYLVRHAKSSWDEPGLSDLERPLAKRGKREAPMMGEILAKRKEIPELIISSPAKRAFSTAKRIAKEMNYPVKNIAADESLYMGDSEDYLKAIGAVNDSVQKLMLLSHNPGVTYFANHISESEIDNVPTSGVVRIDFEFNSWKEIENQKGKLVFFDYPKKYKT